MYIKKKLQAARCITAVGILLLASAMALLTYNLWDSHRAGLSQQQILEEYNKKNPQTMDTAVDVRSRTEESPLDPDTEMPEVLLENPKGAACIGVLEIPELALQLPVMSEWSYPLLKKAPCRYSGSAYQDNLVIAAHNYASHFGRLRTLKTGSKVYFTDVEGNRFTYQVAVIEALTPQSIEEMIGGEWPLSLFTCTWDGKNRVTVRCE